MTRARSPRRRASREVTGSGLLPQPLQHVSERHAEHLRDVAKLDDVQPALARLVLADEGLRDVEGGSYPWGEPIQTGQQADVAQAAAFFRSSGLGYPGVLTLRTATAA